MKKFLLLVALLAGCVVQTRVVEIVPTASIQVVFPAAAVGVLDVWLLELGDDESASCFPVKCEPAPDGEWVVWMMTARHCLLGEELASFQAVWDDETRLDRVVHVAYHDDLDVGVVAFRSEKPVKVHTLSFVAVKSGEWLIASGFPVGEGPFATVGIASGGDTGSYGTYFGCSGGPITRLDGAVVGVQSAVLVDGEWDVIGFASSFAPIAEAEDWIREWLE